MIEAHDTCRAIIVLRIHPSLQNLKPWRLCDRCDKDPSWSAMNKSFSSGPYIMLLMHCLCMDKSINSDCPLQPQPPSFSKSNIFPTQKHRSHDHHNFLAITWIMAFDNSLQLSLTLIGDEALIFFHCLHNKPHIADLIALSNCPLAFGLLHYKCTFISMHTSNSWSNC